MEKRRSRIASIPQGGVAPVRKKIEFSWKNLPKPVEPNIFKGPKYNPRKPTPTPPDRSFTPPDRSYTPPLPKSKNKIKKLLKKKTKKSKSKSKKDKKTPKNVKRLKKMKKK